jgi:hypothetical protein
LGVSMRRARVAVSRTTRGRRMTGCVWGLIAFLLLGVALFLVHAASGSMVFASYSGTVEFTGTRRFWSTNYFGLKWVANPGDPGPCPVVVHTDGGDVGAAEFAEPNRLLERGWVEVPFQPPTPEALALIGPDWEKGLPRVVKYGRGDVRVATQHTDGVLTGVWVVVVTTREERIAQGLPPEHELMASRVGATRYPVSVGGRRITLPISEAELVRAMGQPDGRRKDY